jgi:hypothetical protein
MRSPLAEEYLRRHHQDRQAAALELAAGLMAGDSAQCKAGYSAASAALTASELFGLDAGQSARLLTRLADWPTGWAG